jgi:UMF1 family MFS transporter
MDIAASLRPAPAAYASTWGQIAWAVYEWARNPYVIVVTIYIWAPYFAAHVAPDPARGQALISLAHTISGATIAVLSPILGAIGDAAGRRKWWIAFFTAILASGAALMWFAEPHAGPDLLTLMFWTIVINSICFEFTAVFHNSMLPAICPRDRLGSLSGLGLALGNVGALVLLIFSLWAFALPGMVDWSFLPKAPLFGLDRLTHDPDRIVGPLVALWLIVFTLPMLFLTPDITRASISLSRAIKSGLIDLGHTLRSLRHHRNAAIYLLSRMIFADGKAGILIFGGVYAAGTFGWGVLSLTIYGIILSVCAFFGGMIGGYVDDRLGSKRALQISLALTLISTLTAISHTKTSLFGLVPIDPNMGHGLWPGLPFFSTWPELAYLGSGVFTAMAITSAYANSRTLLARLVPPDKTAQFFGLYALSGTATSFIAPTLIGLVTAISGSQRLGFSMALVLVGIGFAILFAVKAPARD